MAVSVWLGPFANRAPFPDHQAQTQHTERENVTLNGYRRREYIGGVGGDVRAWNTREPGSHWSPQERCGKVGPRVACIVCEGVNTTGWS